MTQTIKLESLRDMVATGAVRSATILGQKGGYALLASIGLQEERVLGTRRGEVRLFTTPETAFKTLRELGLTVFNVNITHYESDAASSRRRPDVAERMAAIEHARWMEAEVARTVAALDAGTEPLIDSDTLWNELYAEADRIDAQRAGPVKP